MILEFNWNNIRPLGSKADGFEELVCQLAAKEKLSGQTKFYRIGRPDAGKECYWEFENGTIQAWQAKYFPSGMPSNGWKEINDSVIQAIVNHPHLKKYYVCLPLDRPDGKVTGKKSLLTKWNEKVIEWKAFAKSKRIEVEFEYWGNHELTNRLSKKENEGLMYFWFNQLVLTDDWFDRRNKDSIEELGERYSPKYDVEVPLTKELVGIDNDPKIKKKIKTSIEVVIRAWEDLAPFKTKELSPDFEHCDSLVQSICNAYLLDFDIGNQAGKEPLAIAFKQFEENQWLLIKKINAGNDQKINNALRKTREAKLLFGSPGYRLLHDPNLLIYGAAGNGKSHLLADFVESRRRKNRFSLLLLGEQFTQNQNPWNWILNQMIRLDISNEEVFLGALNANAEAKRSRILIVIDALNEGEGERIWPKRLKSFFRSISRYEWLGLIVSIRSGGYLELIAPENEVPLNEVMRLEHEGFSGLEYRAARNYFLKYGISEPNTPFLFNEFQSPLFLKLLCESLKNKHLNYIPEGLDGFSKIFSFYIDALNEKLSKPDELDYDNNLNIIEEIISSISKEMNQSSIYYMDYSQAEKIVRSFFCGVSLRQTHYLKKLISEGLFLVEKRLNPKKNNELKNVIQFSYQRFHDNFKASQILDECLDLSNPLKPALVGKIGKLIVNQNFHEFGIEEALTIELPERCGKELLQFIPKPRSKEYFLGKILNNLPVRTSKSISQESVEYLFTLCWPDEKLRGNFLEAVVSLALKPNNLLNANWLHVLLINKTLTERDSVWTTWLQDKYGPDSRYFNSVQRLIDWAWSDEDKVTISDECILLAATALSWFLTSSNRYLRDSATKALVSILSERRTIILQLLRKFEGVNDPYILERQYAAIYGAILRSEDIGLLSEICKYIFDRIFNQKIVYPHILLRDYARGIIERALILGIKPDFELARIRPPYKSKNLPKTFPSNEEIDKKYLPIREEGHYGKSKWGNQRIISSMTTEYGRKGGFGRYGDFGRYVFQTAFRNWDVDYDGLSNYAVDLIFQLGYHSNLFGQFDNNQELGRGSGHLERIGKKYQWIVFHELLARVSDHANQNDERYSEKKTTDFQGPWSPSIRDIDPSVLITKTLEESADNPIPSWRYDIPIMNWRQTDHEWIRNKNDLPEPLNLIERNSPDGQKWLWLEIHPEWREEEKLNVNRWDNPEKRLWYQIRSYLIKKSDFKNFKNQLPEPFHRGIFPEAGSFSQIFSREFYNSDAWRFFERGYYSGETWSEKTERGEKLTAKISRTSTEYRWEEEFDCSKKEPIIFYKPSRILQEGLNLKFSKNEGEYLNSKGELICLDPSVYNSGLPGLMVQKEALLKFLEENDLAIFWSLVSEKQILKGRFNLKDDPGRMNISGFYYLESGKLKGNDLVFDLEEVKLDDEDDKPYFLDLPVYE